MSEKNTTLASQKNINIGDLIFESAKHWYVIVLTVALCLVLTALYTISFVTPLYTSSAKLFVLSKQMDDRLTSSDFSISTYLSNDFTEIIGGMAILELVAEDIGNKYSVSYLKSAITINKPENTRIVEISIKTPNPKDSKIIVDSVCKNTKEKLVDIMELDSVKIIEEGKIPKSPSSPNLINNLISAGIIAFLISEAIIVLNYIFNNKVSSAVDIEKCLGLTVLATIPYNSSKNKVK